MIGVSAMIRPASELVTRVSAKPIRNQGPLISARVNRISQPGLRNPAMKSLPRSAKGNSTSAPMAARPKATMTG